MPELPEVETVRRGLAEPLLGRRFTGVTVREPRLRWPVPGDLPRQLQGRRVRALGRRGKYLLVDCGAGTLIVHLGMSGSLRVLPGPAPAARHDHLDFGLDDGRVLRYTDPRRFGAVLWTGDAPESHPLLASLGPEPLDPAWTGAALHAALAGKRVAVKLALMDGRVVVGVGNIYANEALFRAGIRPTGAAGRLSAARCERLAGAVKDILQAAIAAGGSTLRDFTDAAGHPGWFQQQYAVYDRAGAACPQCGGLVKGVRQGQRSTFYCARCQR